jgi:predicted Ser/Thr protein kinase
MSKKYKKHNIDNSIPYDIKRSKYLGQGHSGKVYLMPNGKVIKIFKNSDSCRDEYNILKTVEGSCHFPKTYELGTRYMVRDYVGGINMREYLYQYKITRSLVLRIANLVDDLKELGFKKLNLRCSHLFVQNNGTLMLIDPRKNFTQNIPYPKSFLNDLKKIDLLEDFLKILRQERPDLNWRL